VNARVANGDWVRAAMDRVMPDTIATEVPEMVAGLWTLLENDKREGVTSEMGEQPELYAYRCSPDISAAIVARHEQQQHFRNDVWLAWNRAHAKKGVRAGFERLDVDTRFVGFAQDNKFAKIPGLSMSLRRGYATAARGRAGDYWREQAAALSMMPNISDVLREYGIPASVLSRSTLYSLGYEIAVEGTVYLVCERSLFFPADALPTGVTRVALSEFYATREAREAEQAARVAHSGGDR
jgi:hypothetical protein